MPPSAREDRTHLRPSHIRRNQKLDVPIPEYPQHHAPQVRVREAAAALKEARRGVLLARLVLAPRERAVAHGLALLDVLLRGVPPALVRREPGEDEHGLDAQPLQRAQVRLDARRERERQPARRGEQRLARGRLGGERVQVVRGVDPEARVGEHAQREGLQMLPLGEVACVMRCGAASAGVFCAVERGRGARRLLSRFLMGMVVRGRGRGRR
ncbi:hypothetical protein FA95DRAFT_1359653 [Auriscalpium vulgare]|uniref:Uncharacterized protein n=1 Tax=Auriscalpium vulgare TaxID=40419 RepID=A0ACB8RRT2_9AGAM|nr:hypothetical protein FA95DRAFT_1359653 [Auriscalpium vulgare]